MYLSSKDSMLSTDVKVPYGRRRSSPERPAPVADELRSRVLLAGILVIGTPRAAAAVPSEPSDLPAVVEPRRDPLECGVGALLRQSLGDGRVDVRLDGLEDGRLHGV